MIANIILTEECNLSCNHCYLNAPNNKGQFNDINKWYVIKNKLKEVGIDRFIFTGGECTLNPLLEPILKDGFENEENYCVFTNGINISNDIIKYCNHFFISLDGPKDIHNLVRNSNNAYEHTIKTLNTLNKLNKSIYIQTSISTINIEWLGELTKIYEKYKYNLKSINLCAVTNSGKTKDNSIALKESSYKNIICYKNELLEKFNYHIFVKDNIYDRYALQQFVLNKNTDFLFWTDLVNNRFYFQESDYWNNVIDINIQKIEILRERMYNRVVNRFNALENNVLYNIDDLLYSG